MKPRVKNIIKNVGVTSAIVMFYAPVILYVYAYVLYDGVLGNADSNMTN